MEHCRHVGVPLVEEVVQGGGGVRQEDGRLPAMQQEARDIVYLSPDQTRPGRAHLQRYTSLTLGGPVTYVNDM
jgi:hypothetical protein